jgi:curved DNA-binding protein CbpA
MQNNPYDILGVKESDSLDSINIVYKDFMMLLHPDKSNTKEARSLDMSTEEKFQYLQLIRKAYKSILGVRKEMNYPDYNLKYEVEEDVRINIGTGSTKHNLTREDANRTDMNKFNTVFSESQKRDKKSGMEDPYSRGYEKFSGKDFNREGKITAQSYANNIPIETPSSFRVPDMKDNRLMEYIPESAELSSISIGHQELGITSVSNFSMTTSGKGSLAGTDLDSVYGQNFENWEDTIKRDTSMSSRFSDTGDITKRMSQMETSRGGIYDLPMDKKMIRAELDRNNILSGQEKMKIRSQNKRDDYYNGLNVGRINNGVPPR